LDTFNGSTYYKQTYPKAHTGLGIAVVDPNVLTYMKYDSNGVLPNIFGGNVGLPGVCYGYFSILDMIKGVNIPASNPIKCILANYQGPIGTSFWDYEYRFNATNFRSLLNGRPPVIYTDVTVYHGNIGDDEYQYYPQNTTGKTVYQYDVTDILRDPATGTMKSMFFEEALYKDGYNLSYDEQSCRYNKLKNKTDYRYDSNLNDYKPVNKEDNSWYFNNNRTAYYDWLNTRPFLMTINIGQYQTLLPFFTQTYKTAGYSQLIYHDVTSYAGDGNSITTSESYYYNARNQLSSKSIGSSDGKSVSTTYQYPEILSSGTTPTAISNMVDKNIISPIIKQETLINNMLVAGNKTDYGMFNNNSVIMPSLLYQLEVNASSSSYVLRKQVLSYTGCGNPKEVDNDGFRTVYLWGYNDQYPIAEIKGVTYSDVTAKISAASLDAIAAKIEPAAADWTTINNLRAQLPDALITTYTYKPLVGMLTMTDPRGVITYYEYDAFGRLITVKDNNSKSVEGYDYHYKN